MANSDKCTYLIRVQTSDYDRAGTNSKISLKLESCDGKGFTIDNLVDWGKMWQGHSYFDRGNLDIFKGTENYLNICKITLTSDGTGLGSGWLVDFVEILFLTGNSLDKTIKFPVHTWLDTDEPYQLSATVNLCAAR